jgi:hypothetical protein
MPEEKVQRKSAVGKILMLRSTEFFGKIGERVKERNKQRLDYWI